MVSCVLCENCKVGNFTANCIALGDTLKERRDIKGRSMLEPAYNIRTYEYSTVLGGNCNSAPEFNTLYSTITFVNARNYGDVVLLLLLTPPLY